MASDADKTMSEAQPRRPRRRANAEAGSTERPRRLRRGKEAPVEETAIVGKGRATPSRRDSEEVEEKKGGNFITRTIYGLREYFQGVGSELRKVSWPSPEDLRRLSIIVLITLIVTAIALGLISFAFTELFRLGLSSPIILIAFMAVAVAVGLIVSRMNARRSNL